MGEIADMMLEGILCEQCGEFIDDDMEAGFPRLCESCKIEEEDEARRKKKKNKKRSSWLIK